MTTVSVQEQIEQFIRDQVHYHQKEATEIWRDILLRDEWEPENQSYTKKQVNR